MPKVYLASLFLDLGYKYFILATLFFIKPKRLELLYKDLSFRRIYDFLELFEFSINYIIRYLIS